ncbi:Derlin-2/3 [Strigomonas culicis]|uniref:Derlin n=1 Tax=Strigomonas culicis TaxID=28005 RepID=S9UEC8_9TRYP|nr:Derlin-2/3 [Strigomonas culicis]EPY29142.1 Derlin-2/3 [Strigomonas culicis]EPY34304.1 Derlin-2/3 [Strigomonas culicis]|eukprot:EPY26729.1 Derlin-2/3 [Strigomonas culicis]
MDALPVFRVPPVTRTLLCIYGVIVVLCYMEVVHPLQLMYSNTLIFQQKQYWRLFTPFFYYGSLNLNTALEIHWIYVVSSAIEEQYFHRRAIDYAVVVSVSALLILAARVIGIIDVLFMSTMLESVLMYLLSRLLPDQRVALFAVIEAPMRLLPAFYCLMMLYNQGTSAVKLNLVSCFIGHCMWYTLEIFPRITGINLLRLQNHLERLFQAAPGDEIVVN